MAKILVIEDDRNTSKMVCEWLEFQRHVVESVFSGDEALHYLLTYQYDLIILDWELPGKNGVDVLKNYRASGGKTPVIFLTGKTEIDDKEVGLDTGADDYLTKPFELKELSARARALLRRSQSMISNLLVCGDLQLDRVVGTISKNGQELNLTPTEFSVLEYFMSHPNQLISSEALLNHVWKSDSDATGSAARTVITRLRKKIDDGAAESKIENVHGFGYRFRA